MVLKIKSSFAKKRSKRSKKSKIIFLWISKAFPNQQIICQFLFISDFANEHNDYRNGLELNYFGESKKDYLGL